MIHIVLQQTHPLRFPQNHGAGGTTPVRDDGRYCSAFFCPDRGVVSFGLVTSGTGKSPLWLLEDVLDPKTRRPLVKAPTKVTAEVLERLNTLLKTSLTSLSLYRCDPYISDTLEVDPAHDERTALLTVYRVLRPSEPATLEAA